MSSESDVCSKLPGCRYCICSQTPSSLRLVQVGGDSVSPASPNGCRTVGPKSRRHQSLKVCTQSLKVNDTMPTLRILFPLPLLFQVDTAPMLDCGFLGALNVEPAPDLSAESKALSMTDRLVSCLAPDFADGRGLGTNFALVLKMMSLGRLDLLIHGLHGSMRYWILDSEPNMVERVEVFQGETRWLGTQGPLSICMSYGLSC